MATATKSVTEKKIEKKIFETVEEKTFTLVLDDEEACTLRALLNKVTDPNGLYSDPGNYREVTFGIWKSLVDAGASYPYGIGSEAYFEGSVKAKKRKTK